MAIRDTSGTDLGTVTNETALVFVGTGEPGSTIELVFNTLVSATTVVAPDGTWQMPAQGPFGEAELTAKLTAVNQLGLRSDTAVFGFEVDLTDPVVSSIDVGSEVVGSSDFPTLNTNDPQGVLTVATEVGAQVSVSWGDGNAPSTGTATDGTVTLTQPTPYAADGTYNITITVEEISGNVSTRNGQLILDATAPDFTISASASTDTGVSDSDGLTSATRISILFDREDRFDTISYRWEGEASFTPLTQTSFIFADFFNLPDTADGTYTFEALATDRAGNTTLKTLEITLDATPPPLSARLDPASDTGLSNTDGVTNDPFPQLLATTEDGAAIKVEWGLNNGETAFYTGTGVEQTLSINEPFFGDGPQQIRVTVTDAAGNTSVELIDYTLLFDPDGTLTIDAISQDHGVLADFVTSDTTLSVFGTGEAGTTVTLKDGDTTLGTATVDGDGDWRIDLASPLPEGSTTLTATGEDLAGNAVSTQQIVTIDTEAPGDGPATALTPVGAPVNLDSTISETNLSDQSLTKLTNGNLLFVTDVRTSAISEDDAEGAWAAIYSPNGQVISPLTQIRNDDSRVTSVVALEGGGFALIGEVVDFARDAENPGGIFYQAFNADGTKVNADPVLLFSIPFASSLPTDVKIEAIQLTDGRVVVAYQDKAAVVDANGANPAAVALDYGTLTTVSTEPRLVATSDGGFAAVIEGLRASSDDQPVFLTRYTSDLVKVGDSTEVGNSENSAQVRFDLAELDNGNIVLTWYQLDFDVTFSEQGTVFFQIFSPDDAAITEPTRAKSTDAGFQQQPKVDVRDNGDFAITWVENDQRADGTATQSLQSRLFAPDGTARGPESSHIDTAPDGFRNGAPIANTHGIISGDSTFAVYGYSTPDFSDSDRFLQRFEFLPEEPFTVALTDAPETGQPVRKVQPSLDVLVEDSAEIEIDWGDGRGFQDTGDGTGEMQSFALDQPYATEGEKTVTVRATDLAGNQSTREVTFEISVELDAPIRITGDATGNTFGYSMSSLGDIDGDGLDDFLIGAPRAGAPFDGENDLAFGPGLAVLVPGAALSTLGKAEDYGVSLGELFQQDGVYALIGKTNGDFAGTGIAGNGDFDGDGKNDLLISAHHVDDRAGNAGKVYLLSSAALNDADLQSGATADRLIELDDIANITGGWVFESSVSNDLIGTEATFLDDIDGDGNAEIAFSGAFSDVSGSDAGRVFVALSSQLAAADAADGTSDGTIVLGETLPTGVITFEGDAGDIAGYSVTPISDLSGDGKGEMLIGSKGSLYVVTSEFIASQSPGGARLNLATLAADVNEDGVWAFAEPTVAGYGLVARPAGDVDGDGFEDVLAVWEDSQRTPTIPGTVSLISGKRLSEVITGEPLSTPFEYGFIGDANDGLGWWLNGIGDVDGDGKDDIALGAHRSGENGAQSGEVYVISGGALTALDAADGTSDFVIELSQTMGADGLWHITGEFADAHLGFEIVPLGDVNGDGLDDFGISASGGFTDEPNFEHPGDVFVMLGGRLDTADALDGTADGEITLAAVFPDGAPAPVAAGNLRFDSLNAENGVTTTQSTPSALTGTAEAGLVVVVLQDGEEVGRQTVGETGTWSFDLSTLSLGEGEHSFAVQTETTWGTPSETAPSLTLNIDQTAPALELGALEKDGGNIRLDVGQEGLQAFSQLGVFPDGGFVAAWFDLAPTDMDSDGGHVTVAVFDKDNTATVLPFTANSEIAGDQSPRAVLALDDERFAVAYFDPSPNGGGNDSGLIRIQLYNRDGTTIGGSHTPFPADDDVQNDAAMVLLPDGRIGVAAATGGSASYDSVYTIFDPSDGSFTPVTREGKGQTDERWPELHLLNDGNLLTTHWNFDDSFTVFKTDITGGTDLGSANLARDLDRDWDGPNGDIAILPGDKIVMAYAKDTKLFVELRDSFDTPGTPVELTAATPLEPSDIDVASLPDGRFAVAFTGRLDGISGSTGSTFVQAFNIDGTPNGDLIRVNTDTDGRQYYPTLQPDGDDGFIVSWTDGNGASRDIQAQRLSFDGPAYATTLALSEASDSGVAGDSTTNITKPIIDGTAEPGALVRVFVDGVEVGDTTADPSGVWSFTLGGESGLSDGLYAITATAEDAAGNVSEPTDPTPIRIDTQGPTLGGQDVTASPFSAGGNVSFYDNIQRGDIEALAANVFGEHAYIIRDSFVNTSAGTTTLTERMVIKDTSGKDIVVSQFVSQTAPIGTVQVLWSSVSDGSNLTALSDGGYVYSSERFTADGGEEIVLLKLDPLGNILTEMTLDPPGFRVTNEVHEIEEMASGELLILTAEDQNGLERPVLRKVNLETQTTTELHVDLSAPFSFDVEHLRLEKLPDDSFVISLQRNGASSVFTQFLTSDGETYFGELTGRGGYTRHYDIVGDQFGNVVIMEDDGFTIDNPNYDRSFGDAPPHYLVDELTGGYDAVRLADGTIVKLATRLVNEFGDVDQFFARAFDPDGEDIVGFADSFAEGFRSNLAEGHIASGGLDTFAIAHGVDTWMVTLDRSEEISLHPDTLLFDTPLPEPVTNDTTPTIQFVAEPGAELWIDWDFVGVLDLEYVGEGTGALQELTYTEGYPGDNSFTTIALRAIDDAGNETTRILEIVINTDFG
ncbi:MAG: Ig-like domain-containing protein [Pseudomonadota bacterium]